MSAWLAALRIARRDALRHRWRSLLIVVLILVPVAAGTAVDILYRTQTSVELDRERTFGGADARISLEGDLSAQPTQAELEAALPRARVVPEPPYGSAVVRTPGHLAGTDLVLTDHLGDPLTRHTVRLVSGRAPRTPDEVAISRVLADDLGLRGDVAGDRLELRDGTSVTVTGVTQDPFCLRCAILTARTSSVVANATEAGSGSPRTPQSYLIDLPPADEGAGSGRFGRLNDLAVVVEMRSELGSRQVELGDLARASDEQIKAAALVTLIAGLGLLEVVLLAGTAFAVGARRQTRELGLVAAQGGSPRDLRRIVLAQGLLLGVLGTVAGVLTGFGSVVAARPLLERAGNEVMVGLHFGAAEIAALAAVGVLSGLAAALVPALGAGRRAVADALAARFPVPTARSRWKPIVGAALVAAGAGLGLIAAAGLHEPNDSRFAYTGCLTSEVCTDVLRYDGGTEIESAIVVLIGVFIAVAGLLLLTPALLAGIAGLAHRLPSTLRMATRDAARHRHRTGPATAAIAVAVGGAIAISVLIASEGEGLENDDLPAVPSRVLALSIDGALDPDQVGAAAAAAARALPGSQVLQVVHPVLTPVPGEIDYFPVPMSVLPTGGGAGAFLAVGDPDLVVIASGRAANRNEAATALAAGKAIVFEPRLVASDGTIGIDTDELGSPSAATRPTNFVPGAEDEPAAAPEPDRGPEVRLPAVVLPRAGAYQLPEAFVPQAVVQAQGWDTHSFLTLVSYPPEARAQAATATQVAENLGIPVATAAGEPDYTRVVRVGLSAAAVLVGLLGVAMCVALSAAEGRPDLGTLSAVGAPPSRRRRLAAMQALVLAVLGTALGLAFGFYFARVARPATGAPDTLVPWADLLPIVAAVPLVAVLIGLLGTFGRMPTTRRAD